MPDRIQLLEQFIREDPSDPFNYYALGLEYLQTDKALAMRVFQNLLQEHQAYLPTYYQLGKLYEQLGLKDEAIRTFNQGMVVARSQNDLKTLRELSAALEELNEE